MTNRIPPPVLMLAIAAAMWFAATGAAGTWRSVLAVAAFLLAGAFAIPAIAKFRASGTTLDPVHVDRASALVTSGIYRVSRNPMYVALVLLLAAWAIWLGGVLVWTGPAALMLWLDRFQIPPEEKAMQARFGDGYLKYIGEVRRWL